MSPVPQSRIRERESSVVPREDPAFGDLEVLEAPSRDLVMPEGEAEAGSQSEPRREGATVVEPEEWVRARDQIALVVRTTIAEAMLPLQQAIAALTEQNAALARRIEALTCTRVARRRTLPPPSPPQSRPSTIIPPPPPLPRRTSVSSAPPPPPSSASGLARFGALAKKMRDEQGVDVTAAELAGLLLERIAARVDEPAAEELAREVIQRKKTG